MKYLLSSLFALVLLLGTAADTFAQARGERGRSGNSNGDGDGRVVVDERDDRGRSQRGDTRYPRRGEADRDERRQRTGGDWGVDERYERRDRQAKKGQGPAFCRSGAGHPVHGRSWCEEKGWGLGDDGYRYDDRTRTLGDIIFRRAPRTERDSRMVLRERSLEDILGAAVLGRLDAVRRTLGFQAPLEGRWRSGQDGARLLQVQAGDVPMALLTDVDRDGRVDHVRLHQR